MKYNVWIQYVWTFTILKREIASNGCRGTADARHTLSVSYQDFHGISGNPRHDTSPLLLSPLYSQQPRKADTLRIDSNDKIFTNIFPF